ncbi:MAG: PGPGW domain-containing protein [Dermatophilaceae bacterium]
MSTPRSQHGDDGPTAPDDHHFLRDADDPDDWVWRRRVRANPATRRVYQAGVLALGGVLVTGGLVLIPLPGPGWVIVFLGVAVWASEFEPAARLLDFGKARVRAWQVWVSHQTTWLKIALSLATAAFVAGAIWAALKITGIPGIVPEPFALWMRANLAL